MSRSPDRRTAAPGPGELEAGQDLPAPYESPWRLLRRDLIAVIASLRLRLQELWRRNREGDLSVPGFWPTGLAALFWPLLLALALALATTLAVAVIRGLPRPGPVAVPPAMAPDAAVGVRAPVGGGQGDEAGGVTTGAVKTGAQTAGAEVVEPPQPLAAEPPPPPVLELDPLLALLADDDPEHLIRSAHPDPAQLQLELELGDRFAALAESEREQLAQRWLERSTSLGYEQLQLLDGRGQLLGRRARVGSGMILFSATPEP